MCVCVYVRAIRIKEEVPIEIVEILKKGIFYI